MMGYGWGMGPGGWIFMSLGSIVIIGFALWALVALSPGWSESLRRAAGSGPASGSGPAGSAEEILERRFAAGEIDAEQFRRAYRELAEARAQRR